MKKILFFITVGVLSRVIPHPANFTPIAAMAIFGGAYLPKKQAFLIPITAMVLSDLIIGFDSLPMRISVYGSIIISAGLGVLLSKHKRTSNIIGVSLISSVIFFLITNFSVWAFGSMYLKTPSGLFESYFYAIPFFKNTLIGDLFYSGIFFGGYELAKRLITHKKFVLS